MKGIDTDSEQKTNIKALIGAAIVGAGICVGGFLLNSNKLNSNKSIEMVLEKKLQGKRGLGRFLKDSSRDERFNEAIRDTDLVYNLIRISNAINKYENNKSEKNLKDVSELISNLTSNNLLIPVLKEEGLYEQFLLMGVQDNISHFSNLVNSFLKERGYSLMADALDELIGIIIASNGYEISDAYDIYDSYTKKKLDISDAYSDNGKLCIYLPSVSKFISLNDDSILKNYLLMCNNEARVTNGSATYSKDRNELLLSSIKSVVAFIKNKKIVSNIQETSSAKVSNIQETSSTRVADKKEVTCPTFDRIRENINTNGFSMGVDISSYNIKKGSGPETLDVEGLVSDKNVDYVMARSIRENISEPFDTTFEYFYRLCAKKNIPFGTYAVIPYISTKIENPVQDYKNKCDTFLSSYLPELLDKLQALEEETGKKISMPIFFDLEKDNLLDSGCIETTYHLLSEGIKMCNERGYAAGVYGPQSILFNLVRNASKYGYDELSKVLLWGARYRDADTKRIVPFDEAVPTYTLDGERDISKGTFNHDEDSLEDTVESNEVIIQNYSTVELGDYSSSGGTIDIDFMTVDIPNIMAKYYEEHVYELSLENQNLWFQAAIQNRTSVNR